MAHENRGVHASSVDRGANEAARLTLFVLGYQQNGRRTLDKRPVDRLERVHAERAEETRRDDLLVKTGNEAQVARVEMRPRRDMNRVAVAWARRRSHAFSRCFDRSCTA